MLWAFLFSMSAATFGCEREIAKKKRPEATEGSLGFMLG